MSPRGSAEVLEDRHLRALAPLAEGLPLNEVDRRIGCSANSVRRWRDARRRGGSQGLLLFGPAVETFAHLGPATDLGAGQGRAGERVFESIADDGSSGRGHPEAVSRPRPQGSRLWAPALVRLEPPATAEEALERDAAEPRRFVREDWPAVSTTPSGWVPTSSSSTSRTSS